MLLHKRIRFAIWVVLILSAGGCIAAPAIPTAIPLTPSAQPTETPPETATPEPPPQPTPTASPTLEPTVTPTSTPDLYFDYTIEHLRKRAYGGGTLEILEVLAENSWFTRYLFRYSSDGLWIYGFLNVPSPASPAGDGPYPVIIALHGYIEPEIYNTVDYTTGYADSMTRAGYIVFHPNLRGYPPSDSGDNLFRVGMAVDALNLLALVKEKAQSIDKLKDIDPSRIGMWGHSMGGGVTTRVLTVSGDVQAAVLYAAMSGNERQNYEAINQWSGGERGLEELAVPLEELDRISPENYYGDITASVSIHHGRADQLVPLNWSVETCGQMAQLRIDVGCAFYEDMPHTFYGDGDLVFMQNVIDFFNRVLKPR